MVSSTVVLLAAAAAAAHQVSEDGAVLRSSCDSEAGVIEKARRGDRARILFAITGDIGTCYKVSVESGGRTLEGYLAARALTGIDGFERNRAAAGRLDSVGGGSPRESLPAAVPIAPVRGDELLDRLQSLLAANQPEQALEAAEKALKAGRRDANLLAVAGLAAWHSDQPKQAAEYWTESLEKQPHPGIEQMLARARREVAGDRSGNKLVGIRFNFRYDDKAVTPDQARTLVPLLDSEFTRVAEVLGCQAEERITAVIQTPEDYQRSTGAAEWSGGQYDGRIRVALLEKAPGEKTRQVFAHEIVHACLARTGQWPAWLHEGLAQKLAGQSIPDEYRSRVRQMAKAGKLPPLQKMGRSWSGLSSDHAALAYATALMAAEQLLDAYGPSGVRNLLQDPSSLNRLATDLDQRLAE